MTIKHSPTPWVLGGADNAPRYPEGHIWSNGRLVASCMGYQHNTQAEKIHAENLANAAVIVAAVNLASRAIGLLREYLAQHVDRMAQPFDFIGRVTDFLAEWDAATGDTLGTHSEVSDDALKPADSQAKNSTGNP